MVKLRRGAPGWSTYLSGQLLARGVANRISFVFSTKARSARKLFTTTPSFLADTFQSLSVRTGTLNEELSFSRGARVGNIARTNLIQSFKERDRSKHQQRVSRLDGGVEIDDKTFRPLLEVTPVEPQGHVVRENTLAESQQRSSRNSYSRLPLTGCHQCLLPTYHSSASVGSLSEAALDEYGLTPSGVALPGVHANWDVDRSGRVSGILDDDGMLYTNEMLQDDAQKWMLAYARHVRSQFVQNHNHVCTKTCTKYADTERAKSGADLYVVASDGFSAQVSSVVCC